MRLDPKSGEGVITIPHQRDLSAAKAFAARRVGWVTAQKAALEAPRGFEPGQVIPVRGKETRLLCPEGKGVTKLAIDDEQTLLSPGSEVTFGDRVERFLKREARQDLQVAVDRHARNLAVDPNRIAIKDTKSRWGSCSSIGNLNFSWRLILAPIEVLDYVAAHETAHLIEMNHSPAFWSLVKKTYGPYEGARGWLRRNGQKLHSYGKSGLLGG